MPESDSLRVLIADDEPLAAERLQLLLASDGGPDEPPEAVLVHCAGTENPLWTVEGVYD